MPLRKFGLNTGVSFRPSDKFQIRLSAGLQDSEVHKVFVADLTPLVYTLNHSYYFDYLMQFNKLRFQLTHNRGQNQFKNETKPYDYDTWTGLPGS